MGDDEMRSVVLANALTELKAFEKKYSDLQELDGVFKEINKLDF